MKFGCSVDMVNLRYSEPNRNQRDSLRYWEELFKLVSAAGFKGVELPYDPQWQFGGRSGIPLYSDGVKFKYGSAKGFVDFLNCVGIEAITGLHLNAAFLHSFNQDAYLGGYKHFAEEMIEYAAEVGALSVILSPTPDIGELQNYMSTGRGQWNEWIKIFFDRTAENINKLGELSAKSGIKLCVKNEFWSLARGNMIDDFLKVIDSKYVFYSADTAHLTIGKADPVEIVKKYKDRLCCVQFTDTDFVDVDDTFKKVNPEFPASGSHVFSDMGLGKVDLSKVYNTLKECGYDGWITCDSKQTTDIPRALLRMRYYIDNVILKG